jgi:uncharacterized iron-regulated membrane protein
MTAEVILAALTLWTLIAVVFGFALGKRLQRPAPAHGRPKAAARRVWFRRTA